MPIGDQTFQGVDVTQGNGQNEHHGKSGIDGSGDEIRREECAVPAGHYSDGEVEADYGVHGEHQRRGQSGEQQRSHVVIGPMPRRTAPAHGYDAVNAARPAVAPAVAQGSQIRQQPDEPEHQGHGRVGRNREDVPHQGAAKLRLHAHGVGVREHPIEQPRPAHVQQREHARAGHREQRHGLGEPIDRVAPALIQQKQNRRNQRAGVSDADPPHEVRDGESPADRDHDAPNADAFGEQQCHRP